MIRAQMSHGFDAESFILSRLARDHGITVYPVTTSPESTMQRLRGAIEIAGCADEVVGKKLCGTLETYAELFKRIYNESLKGERNMILDLMPCKLGGSFNGRTEFHGDEGLPAFDIPILAVMLQKQQLITLKKDPTIWDRWFNERKDGMAEPADADIKHFALNHVYENCKVVVVHNLDDDQRFEFNGCKLTRLKCVPLLGGATELRVTLQSLIEDRHGIYKWMGKDVRASFEFGDLKEREKEKAKARQPDLPLNDPGNSKQADDDVVDIDAPNIEREKALERERDIARQIQADRDDEAA